MGRVRGSRLGVVAVGVLSVSDDRLGYWRIVGRTVDGETVTLIRDCSPYWCWMHLADDAKNLWRPVDWEWLSELRLEYLWTSGWGEPRQGVDERLRQITINEWRWVAKQGLAFRVDQRGAPTNSVELNENHRRFVQAMGEQEG